MNFFQTLTICLLIAGCSFSGFQGLLMKPVDPYGIFPFAVVTFTILTWIDCSTLILFKHSLIVRLILFCGVIFHYFRCDKKKKKKSIGVLVIIQAVFCILLGISYWMCL